MGMVYAVFDRLLTIGYATPMLNMILARYCRDRETLETNQVKVCLTIVFIFAW